MIRIVLLGRTGNILFQYALGRVLAEKHGVPLVLDASWYNGEGWREISHLLRLPLKARVLRSYSLAARALRNASGGRHVWEWTGAPFLRENPGDQSFDPRFLDAPDDCTLFGYYQTPRYFDSIEDRLRDELRALLEIPREDVPATSVAVHVRRGDYLVHPAFDVCGPDYYRNSLETMRALVPGARFFVFSDDADWCRAAFYDEPGVSVVDSGPAAADPLHDLRLMARMPHHIIANSTYSWWAAWLGKHPDQQVLIPDRWYAKDVHAPIEEKRCDGWRTVGTTPVGTTRRGRP